MASTLDTFNVIIAVAAAAALLLALTGLVSKRARHLPLPPGPKAPWFGLGSVWTPTIQPWRTTQIGGKLMVWYWSIWILQFHMTHARASITGNIIYLYAFGNPIIVLNSGEAADDLLNKREWDRTSPCRRCPMKLVAETSGSLPKTLQFSRRITVPRHTISAGACASPESGSQPGKFYVLKPSTRLAAAIIMKISYGHDVAEDDDIYVTLAKRALHGFTRTGVYGTFLVDYIPLLKYLPGWLPYADFKTKAKEWRKDAEAMLDQPFNMVEKQMASGTATLSFTAIELERSRELAEDPYLEKVIKNVAGMSYAGDYLPVLYLRFLQISLSFPSAGADSTVSTAMSFLLAMTIQPEVQLKAQAELDRILGHDRLPQFEDRSSPPFIDCILWKCLRWNPVTPLASAHYTTENDIYDGYLIPKGTAIFPNIWCILHDEGKYPATLEFKPERFENMKRNAEMDINPLPMAAFGFGRRFYDITKAKDKGEAIIEPDVEYTSGLLR
ncbi:hypothetical protein EW146_g2666 [Bondarzewia mesenterica]|uniref:Cytochrome P450 n=1 Tax=Bondarzewia mesenterica TaxID=1095465 RepID=A0A4V3XFP1_9AGAM|nr:hypothetical protein EW146_g2666 [Bondarzewia mesenterica]